MKKSGKQEPIFMFLKYERVQSFISILPFTAALTLICLELPSIDAVYSMLKKNPSEEIISFSYFFGFQGSLITGCKETALLYFMIFLIYVNYLIINYCHACDKARAVQSFKLCFAVCACFQCFLLFNWKNPILISAFNIYATVFVALNVISALYKIKRAIEEKSTKNFSFSECSLNLIFNLQLAVYSFFNSELSRTVRLLPNISYLLFSIFMVYVAIHACAMFLMQLYPQSN
ncbi:hypothetical protein T03_17670 [Trichinella britovi]|uniref:Uncharacterized protein n=1 Tax=Trichinella britovi TaxID=45882 RepID=A0A0V1CC86_TRIBR|nr:hypothetical protein T03_17670 [Trichinella britovi]